MAPEVLDTQAYNYKVDVFSLGVVMWEVSQQNWKTKPIFIKMKLFFSFFLKIYCNNDNKKLFYQSPPWVDIKVIHEI